VSGPARVGIVGGGRRTELVLRLAARAPEHLVVTGVAVRRPERAAELARTWGAATVATAEELLATQPDVVVVAVPWGAAPDVTRHLVGLGAPVLTETPPAPDLDGLRRLWVDVGSSGLVQVAEQYMLMPAHAVRLALTREGRIGQVTSVQVSSTHLYHAVSMIRRLLGVGFEAATVDARTFLSPLADPLGFDGWSGDMTPRELGTTIATLDFGDGRTGLYDFTENQWFNPLRTKRLVVRGSLGEIVDDRLVRLADPRTPVESALLRRVVGTDLNLEGLDLDHISVDGTVRWRNPFFGARLSEDDLAVVAILVGAARWGRGEGPAPYPLADGLQDHMLALAMEESARTRTTVVTGVEAWAG
jgi:predicted dehydrogenase